MKKNFKIHFIGIGGISMSALAKLFIRLKFEVSGSDCAQNRELIELQKEGVSIYSEHKQENVIGKDIVVYNNAIKIDNPELLKAKNLSILIFSRSELLNILSSFFDCSVGVCGCHGKTTATSMIANIVKDNFKCLSHIGGEDLNLSNLYYDGNEVFLTEVCEYAKNINYFNCDIAVCLNIGFDHHDSYKNYNELIMSYYAFLDRADTKVVNNDDIFLNDYKSNNKITFAIRKKADFNAKNIRLKKSGIIFDLYNHYQKIMEFKIKGFCIHNVYNALATICVGKVLGLTYEQIKIGLEKFNGVSRRMEKIFETRKKKYYADYAHHPEEIESTLKSVDKVFGLKNALIVFQPHTYSRTKSLINEFVKVLSQTSVVIYKTYPAREEESQGYSGKYLSQLLACDYCENEEELIETIKKSHKKLVLFMGAGDIYYIAKKIIKSLY